MRHQIKQTDYRKLSDEELVRRYMDLHEYNAYNVLFERFGHIVYGMCLSLHIGSATAARMKTEELFITMLRDLRPLKRGGFKPWIYNYIIQSVTGRHTSFNTKDITAEKRKKGKQPEAYTIPPETENIMRQLPANEQLCIKLFYEGNNTLAQIAEKTGIPLHDVKTLLHSAKEHIGSPELVHNELTHIFDNSTCITKRQIGEYVSGHTEAEENHAIEHHLTNCPLCSMAVEGMQYNVQAAVAGLSELNNRFLHDHFSIAYPQVHVSSFVADGGVAQGKRKRVKIPLWAHLLLGAVIATAIIVFFYVETHKLHIYWDGFK